MTGMDTKVTPIGDTDYMQLHAIILQQWDTLHIIGIQLDT